VDYGAVDAVDIVEESEVESSTGFDELGLGGVRVDVAERSDNDTRDVTGGI
jgi:hypothetical protein